MHPSDLGGAEWATLEALLKDAFPSVRPESVTALAGRARYALVDRGRIALRQGEPGRLLLIVEGCVASRRTTADGRRVILALSRAGSIATPASSLDQGADAEVIAIMASKIASWSAPDLRAVAATDPGLALALVGVLGRSLAGLARRLDQLVDQSVRHRLLGVLAEHPDLFFGEPAVLPRTMLPEFVATSREMTGRVVRGLEQEGMIARVGRHGLRLLDPAALEAAGRLARESA